MHVVSSGGDKRGFSVSGGGGGGGRRGGGGGGGGSGGDGGGGGTVIKGGKKGTVYRIGNRKFTLDGKDGKTLDDIIEELVATSSSERNWKGMVIATLVILGVMGLILLSVVALTPDLTQPILGPKMNFGDFLSGNLDGSKFNGTWVSGHEFSFLTSASEVVLMSLPSMNKTPLVPSNIYLKLKATMYGVSPDKKFVFLAYESFKSFRHSAWAKYAIYEVSTGAIFRVSDAPDLAPLSSVANDSSASGSYPNQPFLEFFSWSSTGNGYAFVYRGNLYFRPSVKSELLYPITTDGVPRVIFNGVPDWLYEEEILSSNRALWFSPDSSKLAFVRFNDSGVEEVQLPLYSSPDDAQYVRYAKIRYPKAGRPNPEVVLKLVDLTHLDEEMTYDIVAPPVIRKGEHYITGFTWVTSQLVSVVWMNRAQNLSLVSHCREERMWACQEVYRESARDGWTDLYGPPAYYSNSKTGERKKNFLLVLAPVLDGSHGQWRHVMSVGYGETNIQRPLTHGRFEVNSVHGWDSTGHFVYVSMQTEDYYTASPPGDPASRHLYRVPFNASADDDNGGSRGRDASAECITCALVHVTNETETEVSLFLRKHVIKRGGGRTGAGPEADDSLLPKVPTPSGCLFNEAHFSPGNRFFVVECLGPGPPEVLAYEAASARPLEPALDDGSALRMRTANMSLAKVRIFHVPLSSGYRARVKLILPPEINAHTFSSFPLIVQVYAGPGTQMAKNMWKQGWSSYLASNRGWIIAHIDGRGSGGEGDRRRFEVYERLGTVEVQDQIEAARYLAAHLPIVDPRRVAIWGWSYGGYATLRALSHPDQDIFQCGIAVSPVTDWRFYDSVYAERYMGNPGPTGNFKGYESSQVVSRAPMFRPSANAQVHRQLFLVHGTRDDNVHLQHSMVLTGALVKEDVVFKQQIYPDAAHSMSSVRPHLYLSMESFLDSCFLEVAGEDERRRKIKASRRWAKGETVVTTGL